MKKCELCGTPLNEFDVAFHEHFEFKKSQNCCCLKCNTSEKTIDIFNEQEQYLINRKKIKNSSLTFFISLIFLMLSATITFLSFDDEIKIPFGISFLCFVVSALIYLGVIFSFTETVCCPNKKSTSETYTVGYHYESEMDNTGRIITKKVDDTVTVGDNSGCSFFFPLITAPIWGPFVFIYHLIFTHKKSQIKELKRAISYRCTPEVADAYMYARNKAKKITITPASAIGKQLDHFKTLDKEYTDAKKKIIEKYSVLSQDVVDEKLKSLTRRFEKITINGVNYLFIYHTWLYRLGDFYLVLKQNKDGTIQGDIFKNNNYQLFLDENWLEEFANLGLPDDILEILTNHKNNLETLFQTVK